MCRRYGRLVQVTPNDFRGGTSEAISASHADPIERWIINMAKITKTTKARNILAMTVATPSNEYTAMDIADTICAGLEGLAGKKAADGRLRTDKVTMYAKLVCMVAHIGPDVWTNRMSSEVHALLKTRGITPAVRKTIMETSRKAIDPDLREGETETCEHYKNRMIILDEAKKGYSNVARLFEKMKIANEDQLKKATFKKSEDTAVLLARAVFKMQQSKTELAVYTAELKRLASLPKPDAAKATAAAKARKANEAQGSVETEA